MTLPYPNIPYPGLVGDVQQAAEITANFAAIQGNFTPTTVSGLPTPTQGMRGMVTNNNGITFHAILAAGGTDIVPCWYDGTNWRVG